VTRRLGGLACAFLVLVAGILAVVTKDPWPSNDGLVIVTLALGGTVVLAILRRQPGNAVGWLFLAAALVGLVDTVAREYLVLDYRQHGGSLPLGRVAVEIRGGMALLPFLILFPVILLFPDGKAPSRRWRHALWAYALGATVFSVAQFADETTTGKFAVDIRGGLTNGSNGTFAGLLWGLLTPFFLVFWLASVGHQIRRWREANGERRAQLKWLMSGAAISVVCSVVLVTVGDGSSLASRLVGNVALLGIATLPVAIGVGILKYRLYEIDRLISRTLSYAILTGLLVGVFLGIVILATRVLPFSSPIAVAASTLAAAALFNPLRIRVQHLVDRRFNRARYDAEATVAAFRARLRRAGHSDAVREELVRTISRAVEPTSMSLWVRPEELWRDRTTRTTGTTP
jgi:hypothetical protein